MTPSVADLLKNPAAVKFEAPGVSVIETELNEYDIRDGVFQAVKAIGLVAHSFRSLPDDSAMKIKAHAALNAVTDLAQLMNQSAVD